MVSMLWKACANHNGKIFSKSVQLLEYPDDTVIIDPTKRDVTNAFGAIKRESTDMGPAFN